MTREPIGLQDSFMQVVTKLSEGNPGALTVLMALLKRQDTDPPGLITMLDLDDMGMRGSQIWVAYKDHCGHDIEKLVELCRSRDQDMIDTVNRMCGGYGYVAKAHGAS